jgi:endonuclease YncB( thermonuclease family)
MRRSGVKVVVLCACALSGVAAAIGVTPGHATSSARAPLAASVVRIVDGDTLVARLGSGRSERVRLLGIDTPEVGTCYAAQAAAAARALALGRKVQLLGDATQADRDRYGRLLAYVALPGGVDLGRTLVARGVARVYVYDRAFARVAAYRSAEASARTRGLGLWSTCAPSTGGTTTSTTTTTTGPPVSTTTTSSTTATTSTRGGCDASYPTVCIPPPPPDLDCKDVPYHNFKVLPPDPHGFDGRDNDGIGCES